MAGNQPADDAGRVAVGVINAPWGVRGHVKVTPMTENADRFARGTQVYVGGEASRIADVRHPRGFPVVLFDGVNSVEAAEQLRGRLIEIDEALLPDLPEGEYYIHDLIGLAAVTPDGAPLGTLDDVLKTGSNDVYVIKRTGKPDVLVPVLDGIVGEIDLAARTVVIIPVPGLLD